MPGGWGGKVCIPGAEERVVHIDVDTFLARGVPIQVRLVSVCFLVSGPGLVVVFCPSAWGILMAFRNEIGAEPS